MFSRAKAIWDRIPFRIQTLLMVAAALILTEIAYWKVGHCDFVMWDDPAHIADNPDIRGLSLYNFYLFFTKEYVGMYHPLTTISFALEYHFFGLNPAPYHYTNLVFHLLNVVLVFAFIHRLAGHRGIAFFVALFFGIHPMHVESVAWVTERKDVLYTFFYLGALIAYLRYLEPGHRWGAYALAIFLMFLSLLSKSAAVVLPAVLLLLDYYRSRPFTWRVIWDKIPFGLLSASFLLISLLTQKTATYIDNIRSYSEFIFFDRIQMASYAILFYIQKFFMPTSLSFFYPLPEKINGVLPLAYRAAPFVLALLIYGLSRIRSLRREIVFGCGFLLINIVLVIQLVPLGAAITADRYTYLAYLGPLFLLGYAYVNAPGAALELHGARLRYKARFLLVVLVAVFASAAFVRVGIWLNSETLFSDGIRKDRRASVAYFNWANILASQGDYRGALRLIERVMVINPDDKALTNRGHIKFMLKDYESAIIDYDYVIKKDPWNVSALQGRAKAKIKLGFHESAREDVERAKRVMGRPSFNP